MDSFDSLSALANTLPAMPGHASLPPTEHFLRMRKRIAVEKAMEDNPDDKPAQIDAIAKIRCYFMGGVEQWESSMHTWMAPPVYRNRSAK